MRTLPEFIEFGDQAARFCQRIYIAAELLPASVTEKYELQNIENKKCLGIHPTVINSNHHTILDRLPDQETWHDILKIYSFRDRVSFADTWFRLLQTLQVSIDDDNPPAESLKALLLAYTGRDDRRIIGELKFLNRSTEYIRHIHSKRNIAVKTLEMIPQNNLTRDFIQLTDLEFINNNTFKDLLLMYADFKKPQQLVEQIKNEIQAAANKDQKYLSQKLSTLVRQARFPEYIQLRREIDEMLRRLNTSKSILVTVPRYFEPKEINIAAKLKMVKDVEKLQTFINDTTNHKNIEKLLEQLP